MTITAIIAQYRVAIAACTEADLAFGFGSPEALQAEAAMDAIVALLPEGWQGHSEAS